MTFAVLTYPLALLGLAALPALAAIYILRNRFRRQTVSSLLLWQFAVQSKEGGSRVNRLQLPWVFFLELLALALLVTAATGPRWQLPQTTRPLLVVLDDSESMNAESTAGSARQQAIGALEDLLQSRRFLSIRLIAAGREPALMGGLVHSQSEVRSRLEDWRCQAPMAALESALTLASELGNQEAEILVLTDHPPPHPDLLAGRVQWRAFGEPAPNVAFVNAARTAKGEGDRCLLEIANYSPAAANAALRIRAGEQVLREENLRIESRETHRLIFEFPPGTPPVEVALPPDALRADNRLDLLPPPRKKIRVQVSLDDQAKRELIVRTLEATGLRSSVNQSPELVFHSLNRPPAGDKLWTVGIPDGTDAQSFTGPFVLDSTHPLAEGLGLEGVIWAALPLTNSLSEVPVLTAGNVPLISDREDALGRHHLTLNLAPSLSTITATPDWPVLFWNLLNWRARQSPGLTEHNVRLGTDVRYKTDGGPVTVVEPAGAVREFPAPGPELILETHRPGIYTVTEGEGTRSVAVNFLVPEESDLSQRSTGRWGSWDTVEEVRFEYANVLWMFLLAALAVLVLHLFVVTHGKGAV